MGMDGAVFGRHRNHSVPQIGMIYLKWSENLRIPLTHTIPHIYPYLYWTWFTMIILYRLLDWLSFFQLFCAGPTEVAVVGGGNQIRLFLHRSPQAVAHRPAEINVWELSHFLQTGPTFPVFPDVFASESSWGFIQEPAKRFCKKKKRPGRRKFRSQTSDNMDRWKAEQGRGREKRKIRREKIRRERVRRKKMQMREKVGKSRNTVFFQWFVAPEGRKVGLLKRRVRSQLARREMKNCTPLWREAHFQVKMYKAHHGRSTFGSWDVKKVHAVVARSTFPSQNVQNTRGSDHFWKLRCRKSARRCGAKHISKSKCTKH